MDYEEKKKLIGLLAFIVGAAIIAPRETSLVLDAISKQSKKPDEKLKQPIIENTPQTKPIEQLGLIRRTKKNIITNVNKFWKWVY